MDLYKDIHKNNLDKVEQIFYLYTQYGTKDYIGESITQIEHMVQAAMLAEKDGYDIEMILACLFHDIGHLIGFDKISMGNYGIKNHEKIGADFLRNLGFPEKIPLLIQNHVITKKYLAYKNPEYIDKLSKASRITLGYQGGIMSPQEANEYEKEELFNMYLQLRYYDDAAKKQNVKIKSLEYYKKMCLQYLNQLNF